LTAHESTGYNLIETFPTKWEKRMSGNSCIGPEHGDFEQHTDRSGRGPGDTLHKPSRDYRDGRPGGAPPSEKIADERSSIPNREQHKGY
jgi:hypothetical protein